MSHRSGFRTIVWLAAVAMTAISAAAPAGAVRIDIADSADAIVSNDIDATDLAGDGIDHEDISDDGIDKSGIVSDGVGPGDLDTQDTVDDGIDKQDLDDEIDRD